MAAKVIKNDNYIANPKVPIGFAILVESEL